MDPHVLHQAMSDTAYFQWLGEKVNLYRPENEIYSSLCHLLMDREYYWIINNDDNRAADGQYLRVLFSNEIHDNNYFGNINTPCTMFEMLVALAMRVDDILYDSERGCQIDRWFWMLISNLGLDKATDAEMVWNGEYGEKFVNKTIDFLLERKYGKKGIGSLFPLHSNRYSDRKDVEIWYQMHDYIDENFGD
jgi:hypothetical protein